jgi:antitoxin component of MazEF toxin-antitoxin module
VRLPKEVVARHHLVPGSSVTLRTEGTKIIVDVAPVKKGSITTADWKNYIIPMNKQKKENISENIDHILYGAPRR